MLVLTNSKIFYSPWYYIDSLALYMLNILATDVLYHVIYTRVDAKGEA